MEFTKEVPDFQQRESESRSLLKQFPNKVPTVIEPQTLSQPSRLDQNKYLPYRFLIPAMYTFHEFVQVLRRRMNLQSSESLWLDIGNSSSVPPGEYMMYKVYETYKSPDGFLYVKYCSEATYG